MLSQRQINRDAAIVHGADFDYIPVTRADTGARLSGYITDLTVAEVQTDGYVLERNIKVWMAATRLPDELIIIANAGDASEKHYRITKVESKNESYTHHLLEVAKQ